MSTTHPIGIEHFVHWLASGSRGRSSEAIVGRLTGVPVGRPPTTRHDYPYDPDDFQRCERLLRAVPLARSALPLMRDVSPEWAGLVDDWDNLADLLESEIPGVYDGKHGCAPKTYERMRAIYTLARKP